MIKKFITNVFKPDSSHDTNFDCCTNMKANFPHELTLTYNSPATCSPIIRKILNNLEWTNYFMKKAFKFIKTNVLGVAAYISEASML